MAKQPKNSQFLQYSKFQAQLELLEALLILDESYPWNPAELESQTYWETQEKDLVFEELADEAIEGRSPVWLARMEQLWSAATPTQSSVLSAVQQSLSGKFGACVPVSWLEAIAHHAVQIFHIKSSQQSTLSVADQLVHCVYNLLPDWAEEDLQVLARPFAHAMRGEALESTLAAAQQGNWTELSHVEQARLSLAIARYVLVELENFKP